MRQSAFVLRLDADKYMRASAKSETVRCGEAVALRRGCSCGSVAAKALLAGFISPVGKPDLSKLRKDPRAWFDSSTGRSTAQYVRQGRTWLLCSL